MQRDGLHNLWRQLLTDIKDQQTSAKDTAINEYAFNSLYSKGNREKARHFLLINNWYTDRSIQFHGALSTCRNSLENLDRTLSSFADYVRQRLVDDGENIFVGSPNLELFDEPRQACEPISL